jgi:hypothetical protein
MDEKKKKMLEKLRKNRMSKSRDKKRRKNEKTSRSTSPRPNFMKSEDLNEEKTFEIKKVKPPVSRFEDTPRKKSIKSSRFEVESPFNEKKGPPSQLKRKVDQSQESDLSKVDPSQSRDTKDGKSNRFQRKYVSTNDLKSMKRDKSKRSVTSKRSRKSRNISQSRSPSSRKLNLPKYLTRKNSKFNKNRGSVKAMTNYPKIKYILTHVLLVGKWNEKRKKKYLEYAKKFQNNHMVVVFKNKNGHDCLGKIFI